MALVTIIGRGHSGTRAIAQTLRASGVYMGAEVNESGDLVPPEGLYEACRVFARYVTHRGGVQWDFSRVNAMKPDPAFVRLVETYLASVLNSKTEMKGWKLPETTLIFPWIVKMYPDAFYIYWYRDPRDSILGAHITDDLASFGVPCERSDDPILMRAISWKYQAAIMRATPVPPRVLRLRFEDYVLQQNQTLRQLEDFLGIPIKKLPVQPEAVGRWKKSAEHVDFPFIREELATLGYGNDGD